MKPIVYLDICCFNRPYDDQLQPLIRVETEAKLLIQSEVIKENLDLVWSFIHHYENKDNPFMDRRNQIALWESQAKKIIIFDSEIFAHSQKIMKFGIKPKDALHLACAIASNADFFITTDKKLLNKQIDKITIINPMEFIRRYYND